MIRRPLPSDIRSAPGARSGVLLWKRCCAGLEPAEALDCRDREDLVAALVARGWSVVQIAALTRMSTYTTARICNRVASAAFVEALETVA